MNGSGAVGRAIIGFAVVLGSAGVAQAFHAGGTAECSGCHVTHAAAGRAAHLLRQSDSSSVCLVCHQDASDTRPQSFRVATADISMPAGSPPIQRTPGGDFGWLKKDYTYEIDGVAIREDGSSHGHNIVAADFGFLADPRNVTAPGGLYRATDLGCTSCHDPHGKYRRLADGSVVTTGAPIAGSGSYDTSPVPTPATAVGVYRLLAGTGYTTGLVSFPGVPDAVAPETYNRSEAITQTRVAYGHATGNGRETWANWCGTCHPAMLNQGHRVDVILGPAISETYALYVKSGDLTGSRATSFLSLVPFVENTSDYSVLGSHARSDDSALNGPDGKDLVSCLTCHRAHASGWESMMRWNQRSTFLVYDATWPGTDTTPGFPEYARGRRSLETQAAYYDRPWNVFATHQRSLCNKCHARD